MAFRKSKFADSAFWVDLADRALISFAQGLLTTGVFESTGLVGLDWQEILSLAGGFAVASVLSTIAFRDNTDVTKESYGEFS